MDIGKGFTFYKEDDKWLEKLGIAIGLMILGFLILPVMILSGYAIRLVQNVRDGQADPLPDWDDWGGDLARGFKMWVVQFVWAIPIFLFTAPMAVGGAITDYGGFGDFVGSSILICASCLMFLYGIFVFLAAPGYTISFAKDEHIGSGLQLTTIWQWTQANLGQVIIATLVIMAAGFIVSALAGIVGFILCGIGLILTMPLASVLVIFFQHHLYGQLANEHPMYDSPTAVAPVAPAPVTPPATAPSEVVAAAASAAAAEATDAGEATADAPSPDDAAATVTVTETTDAVVVDEQAVDAAGDVVDIEAAEVTEVSEEATPSQADQPGEATADAPISDDAAAVVTVTETTDAVVVDEQAVDAAGDVVDIEAAEVTEVSEEATPPQADQPGEATDDANDADAGDADAQDGPDAPADQQG